MSNKKELEERIKKIQEETDKRIRALKIEYSDDISGRYFKGENGVIKVSSQMCTGSIDFLLFSFYGLSSKVFSFERKHWYHNVNEEFFEEYPEEISEQEFMDFVNAAVKESLTKEVLSKSDVV